jgi:hypothetical protein
MTVAMKATSNHSVSVESVSELLLMPNVSDHRAVDGDPPVARRTISTATVHPVVPSFEPGNAACSIADRVDDSQTNFLSSIALKIIEVAFMSLP